MLLSCPDILQTKELLLEIKAIVILKLELLSMSFATGGCGPVAER